MNWNAGQAYGLVVILLAIFSGFCLLPGAAISAATIQESKPNFDGPAELPRIFIKSSIADTPAPGKVSVVKAGESVQAALDGAACGDTIKLEAGATFEGHIRLPNKPCDDGHWIILRTAAPDDSLPSEGTRISPCYAGVASLPGRPDFHCPTPRNVMARITFPSRGGSGPIFFSAGANHYRLVGLEVTREPTGATITALAAPEGHVPADHIIFDRVWFHGSAQEETTRGVFFAGTTYMAVVDSYFSDFHCVVGGTCTDSQAIAGGAGDLPMGPFKIVNNFLEASGENIIFGGGKATKTPADIEIRHNYLYKPAAWMPGHAGFVGGPSGKPFIVKNLFEIKNAQRVLFEGNVLENNWGGFSQAGFGIMITPKNPAPDLCPLCRVTDITIRYSKVSHVGGGVDIANALAGDKPSAAGERYSLHDLVFDDIDGQAYSGFGLFLLVMANAPPLSDVKIDHITAFPTRAALSVKSETPIANFVFTNNIVYAGERQVTSAGGGPANCAFQPERLGPSGVFKSCFPSAVVSHNVVIQGSGWPPDNFTPTSFDAVGFVDQHNGKGGDYGLCKDIGKGHCKSKSRFIQAGTDGKDIGADMEAIEAATHGAFY